MDERFRWLLVAVGAGLLCLAPGCSQDSKPASVSAGTDVASATLGPEGGELTSKDGRLLVHVPPGALSAPLTLSVAPAASSPTGALGPAYDLMPHGTRFNVPIGIRIANDIAVGSDETVGIVTVIDGKWVDLAPSGPDQSGTGIFGSTPHFSTYSTKPVSKTTAACGSTPPKPGQTDPCLCDQKAWTACCKQQQAVNGALGTWATTSPVACTCANVSGNIFDCYEKATGNDFGGCTACERKCCSNAQGWTYASAGQCGCSTDAATACFESCAAQGKNITKCEAQKSGAAIGGESACAPPEVKCGGVVCQPPPIAGASACCVGTQCGASSTRSADKCLEKNQPGSFDPTCPSQTIDVMTLKGCCKPNGSCGVFDTVMGFGCVDPGQIGGAPGPKCGV